jgi:hypothetical protein
MSALLPQFASLSNVIVDVSHHNGRINFEALKAGGIRGVIQKATQGQTGTDPTYETNKSRRPCGALPLHKSSPQQGLPVRPWECARSGADWGR